MKPLPVELSTAQMAELLGCSPQHLGRWEREGVVEKVARDRFSTRSVARVIEHLRRRSLGPDEWHRARTRKMEEAARLAEMDRLEREKVLIRADILEPHWLAIATMVRNAVLALPRKMAAQVSRCRTPEEAEQVLMREVRSILTRLSQADYRPAGAREVA